MVMERSKTLKGCLQTFMERSGALNGCNAKRPRTFKPERSNALERIVENVYVSKLKDQL
jgi:hypothetical protein